MEQAHVFKSKWFIGATVLIAAALVGLLWLFLPRTSVHAANERIVTIYHDGIQQIVASNGKTVGDVLNRANITLHPHDLVEPNVDTVLIAPNYDVNIYRARPVTIVDGTARYHIMSAHTSPREIAQDAGITVYDEDILQLNRIDDFVSEQSVGLILTITPSVPLKVVLYDKSIDMRTQAKTVSDFLKEKGIVLHDGDKLWPSSDTPITPNLPVAIYRDGSQAVQQVPIAFETQRILDADQNVGYIQVKEVGQTGTRFVIDQIETKNGQQVKTELQSIVIAEPKNQIEIIGTKTVGFSGGFADALARLRSCEGHYTSTNERAANPANWYYGAYQFDMTTWAAAAPDGYKTVRPDQAPPDIQDAAAHALYMRRGWQPWPVCSTKQGLQDIYR